MPCVLYKPGSVAADADKSGNLSNVALCISSLHKGISTKDDKLSSSGLATHLGRFLVVRVPERVAADTPEATG